MTRINDGSSLSISSVSVRRATSVTTCPNDPFVVRAFLPAASQTSQRYDSRSAPRLQNLWHPRILFGDPAHALTWVDAFLMCHCHWRRRRALRLTTTRWKQCRKRPSSAKTADCRVWRARLAPGAQVGVGDGARKAAEPPLVHDVGARDRNSKPIPAIEGDLFTPSHSRSLTVAREVGVSLCIESVEGASVVFGEGEIILNSGG